MPLQITQDNFEKEVLQAEGPVLVDFWAPWCGPCRMFGPVIEEAAAEVEGLTVGKVNVDEEGPLAERYGIMSIPTVILFLNGRDVKRETGAMSKEDLIGFIKT